MCRPDKIATFPLDAGISKKGMVVSMDFYPYPNSTRTTPQTIFSVRNTVTNVVSLRLDYFSNNQSLNVWINPVSANPKKAPYYVLTQAQSKSLLISAGSLDSFHSFLLILIHLGSWNRLTMEIIQAQPLEQNIGYSSVRLFANSSKTSRVYFGKIENGDIPIPDGTMVAFDICGARDSSTTKLINTGSFDIMNMFWLPGAQVVYKDATGIVIFPNLSNFFLLHSDKTCQNQVFIDSLQAACVQCSAGYKMIDNRKCVTTAPNSSYFLHSPTNSYQRNIKYYIHLIDNVIV